MPDISLKLFRDQVYHCLGNAQDAVFELTDAAILTRSPESLAELSLSPVFRRKWHSTYEALEDCNPSRDKMMELYIKQIRLNQRPLLVGDSYCLVSTRCSDLMPMMTWELWLAHDIMGDNPGASHFGKNRKINSRVMLANNDRF